MHIYFMGVCGTAMGNVAIMMRELGHRVSGADTGVYPPMSDALRDAGIEILEGWSAERLAALAPDLVVVGNAMSRGNSEVEWLMRTRALPMISLPALLGEHLLSDRRPVVITGTHGKTTTTALAAYLLRGRDKGTGWLVGGVPRSLPGGSCAGEKGAPFVIEGDEYDSAFFDKRSKFIHYRPQVLVINNLEFDHGDIFRDLEDIQRSFRHLLALVPQGGYVLYNADEPSLATPAGSQGAAPLLPVRWCECISVGTGEHADLRICDFKETASGSEFTLRWRGTVWGKLSWQLSGLFNARNAAMALLASALTLKPEDPFCVLEPSALAGYQGVRRRQEVLAQSADLVVVEDFGHHPTALAATLESLRARYPGYLLRACFEPRSNTACSAIFQERFTSALALADACYLAPVGKAGGNVAAGRLDTAQMAAELTALGLSATAFADNAALLERLRADCASAAGSQSPRKQCVVFFSNGSFGGIIRQFADSAVATAIA